MNGKVLDDKWAFVTLPPEAGGGVARLRRWLYGMRPAAKAWEDDYAGNLQGWGFRRGLAAPTVFYKEEGDVSMVVHGDDFTAPGPDDELTKLEAKMREWYEVKTRGRLGPDRKDDKEIRILNRKVKWLDKMITYEADERNIQAIIKELGCEDGSKGLDAPMVLDSASGEPDEELGAEERWRFRRIAALANYVALDRPDLQTSVSCLCSDMVRPTQRSWARLKRVGRYLLKHRGFRYE